MAAALLLPACAAPAADADLALPEPSGELSAAPPLLPLGRAPRDTREVTTPVFSLLAPAAFTESARPGPGGVQMVVLSGSTGTPGAVAEVVAFSDPEPGAPVQEQMAGLVVTLLDVRGARDVSRQVVPWPGTEVAVVVSWTEDTAVAGGGSVTQTFTQLAVQTEDGRSATAVAVAPADELDTSGVLEVLRSLSVEPA